MVGLWGRSKQLFSLWSTQRPENLLCSRANRTRHLGGFLRPLRKSTAWRSTAITQGSPPWEERMHRPSLAEKGHLPWSCFGCTGRQPSDWKCGELWYIRNILYYYITYYKYYVSTFRSLYYVILNDCFHEPLFKKGDCLPWHKWVPAILEEVHCLVASVVQSIHWRGHGTIKS